MVSRVSSRGLTWVCLVFVLASCAVLALQLLPYPTGDGFFYVVRTVTAIAAAIAMLVWSRRAHGRLRRARLLLGCALLVGILNGILLIATVAVTGGSAPVPSWLDLVYFATYPLTIAGLLAYPTSEIVAGSWMRSLLDGIIAASALWFCIYALVLVPAGVGDGAQFASRLTLLAYPALAVFVIGMIASVVTRVSDEARREVLLICAGLLMLSIFEVAWSAQVAKTGSLRMDNWIGAIAELGLGFILFAALSGNRVLHLNPTVSRWLPALPFVSVVGAAIVGTWLFLTNASLTAAEFGAGIIMVVALMLRQIVSSKDRDALLRRLSRREQLFRSLVHDSSDLITLQTPDGRIAYSSPAMTRFTGEPEDVLVGSRFDELIHATDLPSIAGDLADVRATPGLSVEFVCRIESADGSARWMQTQMHNRTAEPSVSGIVCNTRDIHDSYVLEQQLRYQAYHDALTGLGNLSQARELLSRICYGQARPRGSVILVDLDGFKAINDTYGHPFGDKVLHIVSERLLRCVGGRDIVTRIGGDEFVIVLDDEAATTPVVERIMELHREPVVVGDISLSVGSSVGIAIANEAFGPDQLLRNADLAMYVAKSQGRNRAYWYEAYMFEASSLRMETTRGLRRALDEHFFSLNYQPIVRLSDGVVIGCEALLRWDDPERGRIPPEDFIGIAEDSGLITEIGTWVLHRVCSDISEWRSRGIDVPRVSMNLSRRQITGDLPGLIASALQEHGLQGSDICVEITESAVLADVREAAMVLSRVRALGVKVALDDFGTGQSSVSQLTILPVDQVKIDKSFVVTDGRVPSSDTLLRSIVTLCASLSLPTVAEGIEDRETAMELLAAGCEFGQGFYFAKPQPAEVFAFILESKFPRPRENVETDYRQVVERRDHA